MSAEFILKILRLSLLCSKPHGRNIESRPWLWPMRCGCGNQYSGRSHGLSDIHTLEDIQCKGVVARPLSRDGYVVLNADNPHCASIAKTVDCIAAYFSMWTKTIRSLKNIAASGGIAAIYENGFITIKRANGNSGSKKRRTFPYIWRHCYVYDLQRTGSNTFAAYVYGFDIEDIRMESWHLYSIGCTNTGRDEYFRVPRS